MKCRNEGDSNNIFSFKNLRQNMSNEEHSRASTKFKIVGGVKS